MQALKIRPPLPQKPQRPTKSKFDDAVAQTVTWCEEHSSFLEPLPEEAVLGAKENERKLLRALGGVAKALAAETKIRTESWPDDVVSWIRTSPDVKSSIIDLVMEQSLAGEDVLGTVYERLVAGAQRRRLGTFFTPKDVMSYIEDIVKRHEEEPAAIADPGAGVGAFSASALKLWPEANVHAVDINLVTLGLLAASPALAGAGLTERLTLWRQDFLSWLTKEWKEIGGRRLIYGNPPYTRHQLLSMDEKRAAAKASGVLAPAGRAGLSTYFLAASLRALRAKDSLCLLLPINWLEADYARSVRRYLWLDSTRPTEIHLFPDDEEVFPTAQVSAMVLFVGPQAANPSPLYLFEVKRNGESGFEGSLLVSRAREGSVPRTFMPSGLEVSEVVGEGSQDSILLGDILKVRRGVATGSNTFFLRTDKEVQDLPPETYRPALARLREVEEDDLTEELHNEMRKKGERCWILNLIEKDREQAVINELLTQAESEGIQKAYLCRTRRPVWYELERIPTPHIMISPMSKSVFRVIINTFGVTPTNTLYGLYLEEAFDSPENRRRLAEWLRGVQGQSALKAVARRHGDRLLKLEPRALLSIQMPMSVLRIEAHPTIEQAQVVEQQALTF
ncbi:Eco57I restriction-modification methylase domain-containing protein [Nonomuraea africana]|uniref:Eco57I restriction-modification methylase domain-containing protein n=1 Tax=Nonomuraea africana TaxID=46171 RepID=UPI0033D61559